MPNTWHVLQVTLETPFPANPMENFVNARNFKALTQRGKLLS